MSREQGRFRFWDSLNVFGSECPIGGNATDASVADRITSLGMCQVSEGSRVPRLVRF